MTPYSILNRDFDIVLIGDTQIRSFNCELLPDADCGHRKYIKHDQNYVQLKGQTT